MPFNCAHFTDVQGNARTELNGMICTEAVVISDLFAQLSPINASSITCQQVVAGGGKLPLPH